MDLIEEVAEKQAIIDYIAERKNDCNYSQMFSDLQPKKVKDVRTVTQKLVDEGLAEWIPNMSSVRLTNKGLECAGGNYFLFQVTNNDEAERHETERLYLDKIDRETKINQHKLSSWQVKYYWIPFVVSGISVVISVVALIINWFKK